MRTVLKYLGIYKKELVLSPLFKLLEAGFELIVPLVIASIIDVGIGGGNTGHIVKCGIFMVILGLVGLICAVTAQFFAARAAVGTAEKIRSALFKHIQTFSYTQLDTIGTSSLITNMTSDVNQLQTGINLTLRLFLRSPVIVFGAMIMAFTVDFRASIPFVVLIPALCIVVFGIMLAGIPLYKKVQKKLDRLLGITRENLGGARVVRAFNMEQTEKDSFSEANLDFTAAQKFVGGISALMNPLTFLLVNVAIIWLIHKGSLRVNSGDLSQGQLIALYNYMSQILVELVKLANLIITMTKAAACGNRIEAILKTTEPELSKKELTESASTDAIRFENVSLRYQGAGAESLSDISFSIKKTYFLKVFNRLWKSHVENFFWRFFWSYSKIFVKRDDFAFFEENFQKST